MSKKLMAIASPGGHWIQLERITPTFHDFNTTYVTTFSRDENSYVIPDCSKSTPHKVILCAFKVFALLLRERPTVLISTGAAPGALGIIIGNFFGAHTIWIESLANTKSISLGGRICRPFCNLFLTQWEHLANQKDILYKGSVL